MSQYEDLSDFSIVVRALVECFFEKFVCFRFLDSTKPRERSCQICAALEQNYRKF